MCAQCVSAPQKHFSLLINNLRLHVTNPIIPYSFNNLFDIAKLGAARVKKSRYGRICTLYFIGKPTASHVE